MNLKRYRSRILEWKRDFGCKENGTTIKVALVLLRTPITRENLNCLLFEYWQLWDGMKMEREELHPELLTRVATILRARRTVIAKLKKYDYTDPIKKKLQQRGKGIKESIPISKGVELI